MLASCVLPPALADVEFIIVPKPPILTFVHPVSVAFGIAPIPTLPPERTTKSSLLIMDKTIAFYKINLMLILYLKQ